jgi:hypothetical protein
MSELERVKCDGVALQNAAPLKISLGENTLRPRDTTEFIWYPPVNLPEVLPCV